MANDVDVVRPEVALIQITKAKNDIVKILKKLDAPGDTYFAIGELITKIQNASFDLGYAACEEDTEVSGIYVGST